MTMTSELILRTPESRFEALADYPFEPHYVEVQDPELGPLRQHYVDEGSGPVVLLLHGEPSWSYLYRKMIPPMVAGGYRVIAPDLIGFGKSDKPRDRQVFSYARHTTWLHAFLDAVELQDVHLFCQDWGGLLGLRMVASQPQRFRKVACGNTALPTGEGMSDAFKAWQQFAATSPEFPIGNIVSGGCAIPLDEATVAAYDAPFPDESYKAAARAFPALVPVQIGTPGAVDNMMAWESLSHFQRPFLTLFSDQDPVTAGAHEKFIARVPGAANQAHEILPGGGHFLQEDLAPELADRLLTFFGEK